VLLELLADTNQTDLCPFQAHISAVQLLGANGGMVRYQLTLQPWLSALGHQQDSATYQGWRMWQGVI
jgi:type VI secretion system secreted protein VgrG